MRSVGRNAELADGVGPSRRDHILVAIEVVYPVYPLHDNLSARLDAAQGPGPVLLWEKAQGRNSGVEEDEPAGGPGDSIDEEAEEVRVRHEDCAVDSSRPGQFPQPRGTARRARARRRSQFPSRGWRHRRPLHRNNPNPFYQKQPKSKP
eukprot:GHVT01010260.1.p1 GENE.GHVT01010260.1~~GHVT01010260.1.p1  ORF type:complete len:149 (+),score=19.19 GHVT01010260.1:1004-1450(+)